MKNTDILGNTLISPPIQMTIIKLAFNLYQSIVCNYISSDFYIVSSKYNNFNLFISLQFFSIKADTLPLIENYSYSLISVMYFNILYDIIKLVN